jgi:glycerol-3-phosphate acyltransferase PlsX
MRIVVDAMGTDNCPAPDVEGGVLAAKELGVEIILVGDEAAIKTELAKHNTAGLTIDIAHASEAVTMHDKPSIVLKSKPSSSMHVGLELVKAKQADAFVTMGNTGAAHAIAMLDKLRRIPGVKRPALSVVFPIFGRPIFFTDIGANADSKPEWMLQYAQMGAIYVQHALGIASPRVGLLSNGEEEGKGNDLIRASAELLQQAGLNFIGNVEPKEIFSKQTGKTKADVIVSDGFTGNIMVKTYEAGIRYMGDNLRDVLKTRLDWLLSGAVMRPAMGVVRKRLDTSEVGGAPLLGVNGVVIIGHGSSDGRAIRNAVHQATLAVKGNIVALIQEKIAQSPAPDAV